MTSPAAVPETEALLVAQQFETAQFFPVAVRQQLGNELICYGRAVVHQEWPRMRSGTQGTAFNPWGVAMFRTLKITTPRTAVEQTAYDKWLDRSADRELAREDRIHGTEGVIPASLWVVLFFIAGVICVFMFLFADSGERAIVQAVLMASSLQSSPDALSDPIPRRSRQSRIRGATACRDGAHTGRARSGASARGPERAASLRWERGPGSVRPADLPSEDAGRRPRGAALGLLVWSARVALEERGVEDGRSDHHPPDEEEGEQERGRGPQGPVGTRLRVNEAAENQDVEDHHPVNPTA